MVLCNTLPNRAESLIGQDFPGCSTCLMSRAAKLTRCLVGRRPQKSAGIGGGTSLPHCRLVLVGAQTESTPSSSTSDHSRNCETSGKSRRPWAGQVKRTQRKTAKNRPLPQATSLSSQSSTAPRPVAIAWENLVPSKPLVARSKGQAGRGER